ncbi:MAG: Phosphatidylserine/phosphatidylglycerophosphate/cardiolipin synthase [Rubritepida sp.]|nr:Phosphatidylserine/phosphatidylglycerophosphate/cardiolipin synthase [Rubritepida sp.]
MPNTISIRAYGNSDDAFIAWSPGDFIQECRGFQLERARRAKAGGEKVDIVENRTGFAKDKPKAGERRPSSDWPFQRFNWTDHAVDVGNQVRYRVTAIIRKPNGKLGPDVASPWTPWLTLSPEAGDGFSCYFNRGLILSQFVARYLRDNNLTPGKLKSGLRKSADPKFRAFLQGDLGARLIKLLEDAKVTDAQTIYAALYELDDEILEQGIIDVGARFNLVLANGSDKAGDGNKDARAHLNKEGIVTIDRLLRSKGLGHNKFVVVSDASGPKSVWTGSTNWSTTGLCTQINNALLIENAAVAKQFLAQWKRLRDASPPNLDPANFPPALMKSNDTPHTVNVGPAKVTLWFTRTSDGRDMDALRKIISDAKSSVQFLMFTPGKAGLHTLAGQRANEKSMYVRGVVSTLGQTKAESEQDVLDVQLVSSDHAFKPDRYTVVQPQGEGGAIGPWIAEVTRSDFLSSVGHAIVHSKILVIDALTDHPIVVTGSHNFSAPASDSNDENLVIVRGHKALARAYAAHVMSVYQHYRYRSYVREMVAAGKTPWSALDDNDQWLKLELKSKAQEIDFWANSPA